MRIMSVIASAARRGKLYDLASVIAGSLTAATTACVVGVTSVTLTVVANAGLADRAEALNATRAWAWEGRDVGCDTSRARCAEGDTPCRARLMTSMRP
jgi:hypothetical protein